MSRTITGVNSTGITLTNTTDNPVTVTGTITKPSGALGSLYGKGGAGVAWTIDNFGTIGSATGTGTSDPGGIYLGGFASTVTNAVVTNEPGAVIGGNLYAMFVNGPSTVLNKAGATITGRSNAVMYMRGSSTINNYGTISDALNTGIYLSSGGTVLNHVGASVSAAAIAIRSSGVATVVNEGTIVGNSTNAIFLGTSSASNLVIQKPGAVLTGRVSGGAGKFELAAGNGTPSVLATPFQSTGINNFRTLQFDPGAKWTVSGTTSASGLGTITITGFTQGNTIDLKSFVAVNETFASNVLTLRNSANATALLNIQGNFTTSDFNFRADGSGGTYVVQGPLPGPTITVGDSIAFLGGGSAVTLDPTITVTDTQSTTLASATVAISSGFVSGDRLNFIDQNGIAGSFNASSGTLTLSGVATLATYEAALESVTYSFLPINADPTNGGGATSRALSWVVNDGSAGSTAASSAVTVRHVAPTISTTGTISFSNTGTSVALAPAITLADPNSGGNLTGATVSITNRASGDLLNFTNQGGITGSYNAATGVLTLSGTASLATYDTALESVTYGFTPGADPTIGGTQLTRSVSWAVSDGSTSNGVSTPSTTDITEVPIAPTLTASGAVAFTAGGSPVVLDATPTVADPDSGGQLAGATVAITAGLLAGDTLGFVNQNGITGSYNSVTGTLTLSGTASFAAYQSALGSVTFSSSVADPTSGGSDLSRTISWSVTDGQLSSATAASTVALSPPGPVINVTGTTSFTGGGSAIALADLLTINDVASSTLAGASVVITDRITGDALGFTNQHGITGNYDPATGTLTLAGTASLADYEAALRSVTYSFVSGNDPTTAGSDLARLINWTVNDGSNSSSTDVSDLTVIHAPPTVTVSGNPSFTGGGSPVIVASGVTLTDPDSNGLLNGGTVTIGGFLTGDVLSADTVGTGISASYNSGTGVLTLAGVDTIADYQTLLQSVRFGTSPANADATAGGAHTTRQIQWRVSDGSAQNGFSNTGTSALTTVNVAPSVTAGGTASYTGGGAAITAASGIVLSDPDSNGNLVGATISVGGFITGDQLHFTNQNGITGTYQPSTGIVTLAGTASVANYQVALRSITYDFTAGGDPTGGGSHSSRTLNWTVTDGNTGNGVSNTGTTGITEIHALPTLTVGGTVTFSGGGSPVVLDPTASVADPNSGGLLQGATVSISGFIPGDQLGFTNRNGITGSYNAATGVLTLTGAASLTNYRDALASITFGFAPGGDPTNGGGATSRTINWVVNDGVAPSATGISALNAIHTSPTLVATAVAAFTGGGAPVPLDNDVTLQAPDSAGILAGATVAITAGFVSGDQLNFTDQSGINGQYDAATGTLVLTGNAAAASYEAALESITYGFSPANGDATAHGTAPQRTVTWTVSDGVANSQPSVSTIGQNHVGPTITAGGSASFTGGDAPVVLDPGITISDPDSGDLIEAAQVGISDFVAGDTLAFADQGGIVGNFDTTSGVLSLSGTASVANYESALASVTYSFTQGEDPSLDGTDGGRTIVWKVDDGLAISQNAGSTLTTTDAAPTIDVSEDASYIIYADPVQVGPLITLSDPDSGGRLAGAMVAISSGLLEGDRLDFTDQNGISGNYDAASGNLTLSGTASLEDYLAALQSVAFESSAADPTNNDTDLGRTITWQVTDPAGVSSAPVDNVVGVAFASPVISGTVGGRAITDEQAVTPFATVSIADSNPDQTEQVVVLLSNPAHGKLSGLNPTGTPGRYTITGTPTEVTSALRAAVFTPTVNEAPPGETVTTGFTIRAIDTVRAVARDTTTSVNATSIANPPTITHSAQDRGVAGQAADTPFGGIVIGDQDVGTMQTVTVALTDPTGGTLSNLAGGSFDAANGIYTIEGSAEDVTAAVQGLVFISAAPLPGAYVRTTGFTVTTTGPGGTATDRSISVTTASQVLGLENQAGNVAVAVSPDGTSFARAEQGKVNQAIVSDPANGGIYRVPTGYQAMFLGGSANATLLNDTVAGVLMVGNTGNDTISAGADQVTMTGGAGVNTFIASGNAAVIGTQGQSSVLTSGAASTVFVDAGALAMNDTGIGTKVGLSSGSASINLAGSGAAIYGSSGSLAVNDSGNGNVIGASLGDVAATVSGSGGRIFGGGGNLFVALADTSTGVAIGTGSGQAALTVGGSQSSVYGGAGGLTAQIGGNGNVVGLNSGAAALTLTGGAAQVFGGAGALSVLDAGTADTISTGTGPANITAGGNGLVVAAGGGDLQYLTIGGNSTVFGGAGASTVTGGGGTVTMFGGAGGSMTLRGDVGQAVYQAGSGAETLNGTDATSGIVVNGGIDAAGQDFLVAGSGNDSLYAGTGADTMTGGTGSDQFVFYRAVISGSAPSDVITDMGSDDVVYLAGYSADEAARVLATAALSGGGTTVTLSDNTRVTFMDVTSANLAGHIVSF